MQSMVEKIDIQFRYDWEIVRKKYNQIKSAADPNLYIQDKVYGNSSDTYNLKGFGYISNIHKFSPNWYMWSGELFESMLPWSKNLRHTFSELTISHISWSVIDSNILRHFDNKIDAEKDLPQCKLNYIVRSDDPNAITNVYNADSTIKKSYLSTPNSAWLVNVDLDHEVINTGHREILTFKFFNEFDQVLDVFKRLGPMVFE